MLENKKGNGTVKKYDDEEDFLIRKVAEEKENIFGKYIFCAGIILLGVLLSTGILTIRSYLDKERNLIELKKYRNSVEITNNSKIEERITNNIFKDKNYVVTNINTIKVNGDENSKITYNVKYNIYENEFNRNVNATNTSDVLVKFSYSYDNREWHYINNVIRTQESELSPLMGNVYDIAGIMDNLKVSSNNVIELDGSKSKVVYWRSETIFKKPNIKVDYKYKANFFIEYSE